MARLHQSNCPNVEQLQQIFSGNLTEQQLEELADHLEGCEACTDTVRSIETRNEFEDALSRGSELLQGPDDELVWDLIDRLSASDGISRRAEQATSAARPGTQSNLGSSQAAWATEARSEEVARIIAMMGPPEGEGTLGRLGNYRVNRVIGIGGMGAVFEAEDLALHRVVAIKVMLPLTGDKSDTASERFLREARAVAALEHDNIVPLHHIDTYGDIHFAVMPLLRGETLESRLNREGRLTVEQTLTIGVAVARGLSAAHRQGIIHRDIKPSNLWLELRDDQEPREGRTASGPVGSADSASERTRILDFGLAYPLDEAATRLTQSGGLAGTPAYMSPEQARDETVDGRSDLFSLGCVLFRCLAGKPPFPENNLSATLLALALKDPPEISEFRDDVPPPVANYLMTLLNKEPNQRPQSAEEVAIQLGHFKRWPQDTDAQAKNQKSRTFLARAVAGILTLIVMAAFAGLVIRMRTRGGTVVLEFDDDRAVGAVVVIGKRQIVVNPKDIEEPLTIQVDPGSHLLQVTKDDVDLLAERFEIRSNGQRSFAVRFERPEIEKPLAADDAARRAIRWVLAAGGHIHGYHGSRPVEFEQSVLESTDELSVYRIHFNYGELKAEEIHDRAIANLRGVESVELLRFGMRLSGLTDACVDPIATLTSLRGLSLAGQPLVTDHSASKLAQLTDLESLDLAGTGFTDLGLPPLEALKKLRRLDVRGTSVSNGGVQSLASKLPGCIIVSDHTPDVVYCDRMAEGGPTIKLIKTLPTGEPPLVAVSSHGDKLAWVTGNSFANTRITHLTDDTFVEISSEHPGYAQTIAFSPDGEKLSVGVSSGNVMIYDTDNGALLTTFQLRSSIALGALFSDDQSLWLAEPFLHESVSEYRLDSARPKHFSASGVHRLALSGDGQQMGWHQWGRGRVIGWDMSRRQTSWRIEMPASELGMAQAGGFDCIDLSSDGRMLASAGEDGVVRIWDTTKGRQQHALTGHVHRVHRVAFSPDDSLLASSGSDNMVRIWDVARGQLLACLVSHKESVTSLGFAKDGELLVTGSFDDTVRLWELQ